MLWSVKSTVIHAKGDNLKPAMRAQRRNLCYAQQISDSVEWSSKKLWKIPFGDVKTDVKQ